MTMLRLLNQSISLSHSLLAIVIFHKEKEITKLIWSSSSSSLPKDSVLKPLGGQNTVGASGVWWGSGPGDVRAQGLVEGIHISKENINAEGQVT